MPRNLRCAVWTFSAVVRMVRRERAVRVVDFILLLLVLSMKLCCKDVLQQMIAMIYIQVSKRE